MKNVKGFIGYCILISIIIFILSSCLCGGYRFFLRPSLELKEPETENVSLVVGYLDTEEAPANLEYIEMYKLQDKEKNKYYEFAIDRNGIFFNSNILPGTYIFKIFGGNSKNFLIGGSYSFIFPIQGKKEMDPVITKPGIYFVGSYKYKKLKKSESDGSDFDLIKLEEPTEKEILEKILEYAKSAFWREKILQRIEEISK